MSAPLVVKFGGDALATPERIAAAARRLAARHRTRPVVAVASARRGVTDHLLGLVEQVREAAGEGSRPGWGARAASDRAVASGELVAASLLAVALEDVGIPAAVLDAREAGLRSSARPGGATLGTPRPARILRLIDRGITPVVTGFQGWHRGRLTTLGRGGSDITAVALASSLEAEQCELVKEPGALHTADPRLVPEARPIHRVTHRFVTELALAGARVIHHVAAARAERDGVALRFTSLHSDGAPATEVGPGWGPMTAHAVVIGAGHRGVAAALEEPSDVATVSIVTDAPEAARERSVAAAVAAATGAAILRTVHRPHAMSFLVRTRDGETLLRTLHASLGAGSGANDAERRICVGHR